VNTAQRGPSYGHLVAQALARHPDRVAYIHRDTVTTYRQAAAAVAHAVDRLRAEGLRRGDGVAVLSGNRPEALHVLFAAALLGLRYTPLHPLGSLADHAAVLADAEVRAIAVDTETFAEHGRALAAALPPDGIALALTEPVPEGFTPLGGSDPGRPVSLVPEADEDRTLFLAYTGGTTGRPKGVQLSHRALVTNALLTLAHWDWPAEVRYLACTPVTHAAGLIVLPALLRGGTVLLHSGFTPGAVLDLVGRHQVTMTFLVPTMIYQLLDHLDAHPADTGSLEVVVYGAAPMSPDRLRQALGRFGPVFMQLYAQTEAPNTVTALSRADHARPELHTSCGRPLPGLQVEVLDDHDEPVADGEVGELCVRGPLVMDGYWRQPGETARALRGGWLHTGDLGRRDAEGYLHLLDRRSDMIVTGGFNVYPREVEDVLCSHPAVTAAAVVGVPDQVWGEAVTAYVVVSGPVEPGALEAFVRARKGPVHTPKKIHQVEDLPLTPLGKPDRKTLRAPHWTGRQRLIG
jgi:fatty-acyl-CoA synthase